MNANTVTIEQMIEEGSMTAKQAMEMGYRWEAVVTGGDALAIRQRGAPGTSTVGGGKASAIPTPRLTRLLH